MYKVLVKVFYYQGTLNVPENGYMRDGGGVLLFKTKEEAISYITDNNAWDLHLCAGKSTYCYDGDYYLNHGEYARPTYTIVKVGGNK